MPNQCTGSNEENETSLKDIKVNINKRGIYCVFKWWMAQCFKEISCAQITLLIKILIYSSFSGNLIEWSENSQENQNKNREDVDKEAQ